MRQLRIQSDGFGESTVVTLPDGTQIFPSEATIWLEGKEPNRVELTFIIPKVDIHAEHSESTTTCPLCGHQETHYCPEARTL